MSAGGAHSLILLEDGSVRAFGWNALGQLGTGDTADRWVPTAVPTLHGARTLSAGLYHSLATA